MVLTALLYFVTGAITVSFGYKVTTPKFIALLVSITATIISIIKL